MLVFQFVIAILINCLLTSTKSQELLNNLNNFANETSHHSTLPSLSSSPENDLISSPFDNLRTTSNKPATSESAENDFNSLSLENFPVTSNILEETTSTTSSVTVLGALRDVEATPSWELIYPEQNSTALDSALSSSKTPLSSTTESSSSNMPKYFKVDDITNCQKYFGPCLRQVLSNVVPKLKDGYKFLNIPSLDPIYLNATAFQYNSGPFTGYITIRYALIYGLTTMKFKKVDFNKQNEKFKARFTLLVPKMSAIGSYKGDMHVNNVRVRPRGDFNITMTGMGVDMVALGTIIEKDEHKFLRLTKSNATTSLKDSKINATGIFPDQRLNEIVVNVANQYWRDLFNIVLPETRNNWLPILTDTLNAALAMVPFDFLK